MRKTAIQIEAMNLEQVERKLGAFKQKAPKVLKLAVNDTARKARSRLAKEAQKKYAIKGVALNKYMHIKFGSNSNPAATIYVKSKTIPLYKFKRRSGTLGSGRYFNPTLKRYQIGKGGRGAQGQQLKDSSLRAFELDDGGGKRKAFIASMGSGHTGIFQRRAGKKRGDKKEVKELMGSSIPVMIGSEKRVYGVVEPHIKSDLKEAVNRHVSRAIRGEI